MILHCADTWSKPRYSCCVHLWKTCGYAGKTLRAPAVHEWLILYWSVIKRYSENSTLHLPVLTCEVVVSGWSGGGWLCNSPCNADFRLQRWHQWQCMIIVDVVDTLLHMWPGLQTIYQLHTHTRTSVVARFSTLIARPFFSECCTSQRVLLWRQQEVCCCAGVPLHGSCWLMSIIVSGARHSILTD